MNIKRILSALLCLVLLCAAIPALADDNTILGPKTLESYRSNKVQKFDLNYYTLDDAEISYTILSSDRIRIGSDGKLAIPAFFAGAAILQVTAAKTDDFDETTLTVPIYIYPEAPTNVKLSAGKTNIKVGWTAAAGAAYYRVAISRNAKFSKSATKTVKTKKTFHNFTGLDAGKTYYVIVIAYADPFTCTDSDVKSVKLAGRIKMTSFRLTEKDKTVDLKGKKLGLKIGKTLSLTAGYIKPTNATNKSFRWESTDPTVATVSSNGTVTGITRGKTNIIVNALDGSGLKS